jgi:GTP-binding protein
MKKSNRQNIISAAFVKGVVGACEELENNLPQVAFIGRSNAGKSSVINSLTGQKDLARTSSAPGRTREINLFLINKFLYLADLPGYGFVESSREARERLEQLINWYLFLSGYEQKLVVLIIDAELGLTESDLDILESLEEYKKNIIIVANKIDKIKKSNYEKQLEKIQNQVAGLKVIPYSAKKKIGVSKLISEIFKAC